MDARTALMNILIESKNTDTAPNVLSRILAVIIKIDGGEIEELSAR